MARIRRRLAGFTVILGVLFGGAYALGAQFPTRDEPAHEMDHTGTEPMDMEEGT